MGGLGIVAYPLRSRCWLATEHSVLQLLNLYIPYLHTNTERMEMHDRGTSPTHTNAATSSPVVRSKVTKKGAPFFPSADKGIIIVAF